MAFRKKKQEVLYREESKICSGEVIGLRNARIGFRQQEMTHIMENILYNELMVRQFSVDVGVVYAREKNEKGNSVRTAREIDFIQEYDSSYMSTLFY